LTTDEAGQVLEEPTGGATGDPSAGSPHGAGGKIKAARGRMVDEADHLRQRLEDARPRSRTIDSAFRSLAHDTESGGGVLAAAAGFRVFLFMIPFVFTIVVAADVGAGISSKSTESVAKKSGIGGLMAKAIGASASHLTGWSRLFALLAGLVYVFIAGRALLKTLRIIHGLVWHVPTRKPAKATRQVLSLIALIALSMALNVAAGHIPIRVPLERLAILGIYTLIPCTVWLIISLMLPHARDADWKNLLPGAVAFGVGTFAMHLFTVYYIARSMQKKSATYGAIGAALSLLLWAYVLGRIMTASAVVNASVWASSHAGAELPGSAGDDQLEPESAPGPSVSS